MAADTLPPIDPTTADLILNAMMRRSELLRGILDRRRDIDDECGFPKTITIQQLKRYFIRHAVAARVVEVLPAESWQIEPEVYEDEDPDVTTPFEEAFNALPKMLRGRSWAKTDEQGNPVWEILKRVDVISGIGRFGVLLIGIDDGKPLYEPADGVFVQEGGASPTGGEGVANAKAKARRLTFLRCFDESCIQISQWDTNPTSPRYCQPTEYMLSFRAIDESTGSFGTVPPMQGDYKVHWTRVVHVADNVTTDELFGIPRMEPSFNHLMTLEKLYGGSGEMYWQGAFPGFSIETHPQLGADVEIDKRAIAGQIEQHMNGLQRWLAVAGASVRLLSPTVVDPTQQINAQLEPICIKLGCPIRVFKGSERGELASSQDDSAWNDRLRHRQNSYVSPRIVIPFVDRLIMMGILPEPTEYSVYWPDLESLSDKDKASIAQQRTSALSSYVATGINSIIDPADFLSRVLGFPDSEAKAMIEKTAERIAEDDTGTSPLLSMVGGLTAIGPLFQQYRDGSLTRENLIQIFMTFLGMDYERADEFIADNNPEPPPDPTEMAGGFPTELSSGEGGLANENHFLTENAKKASKGNCGTGSGGFKAGNSCAVGSIAVGSVSFKPGDKVNLHGEPHIYVKKTKVGSTDLHKLVHASNPSVTALLTSDQLKLRMSNKSKPSAPAYKKGDVVEVSSQNKFHKHKLTEVGAKILNDERFEKLKIKDMGIVTAMQGSKRLGFTDDESRIANPKKTAAQLKKIGESLGASADIIPTSKGLLVMSGTWSKQDKIRTKAIVEKYHKGGIYSLSAEEHRILGKALGYPKSEIDAFVKEITATGKNGVANANPFPLTNDAVGPNCGIAKGGFQKGNRCAGGGSGGKAKFIGKSVGAAEHKAADAVSNTIAKGLGGIVEEHAGGPGQKDKKPFDVRVRRKGSKGFHDIEVKSMLKGSKTSISVHEDALLRKVNHGKANPDNVFHTIVVDKRKTYDGGAHSANYSGHEIYYKRGSGRYALSKMHKVGSMKELKSLLDKPLKELPDAARGKLPPPPPEKLLKSAADKAHAARSQRDKARKERNRDKLRQQARERRILEKANG